MAHLVGRRPGRISVPFALQSQLCWSTIVSLSVGTPESTATIMGCPSAAVCIVRSADYAPKAGGRD